MKLFVCAAFAVGMMGGMGFAGRITVDGSTTVGPIVKAFAEAFSRDNKGVEISVSESGSGNGAKALVNGLCDVAMLSRPLKVSELRAGMEKGVFPFPEIVAYDAIVAAVHPANPVRNLSVAQLRDVYAGRVRNWRDVGGADVPVVVIARDANSGTFESFSTLVMRGERIVGGAETIGSNGAAKQRIQKTPGAIAFIGIGYLDKGVKGLSVDGVEPTAENVISGKYPISRPLFIFTRGVPEMGGELFRFVNFFLTEKGQEIVEATGFVPVTNY